jgi:signal transduction histidine kinase
MLTEHPWQRLVNGEAADCTEQRDNNDEETVGQGDQRMIEKKSETLIVSKALSRNRLGSRGALFGGFGALLVLMAIICLDSLRTLGAFATYDTQVRQELLYRERTLEQIRAGLYESSNIARDYILIKSDPQAQEILRIELQSIQNETTTALKACIQTLPLSKREPFQRLALELEHYWTTIGPILALSPKEKNLGNDVLRGDVLSRNAEIIAITREVSAVNDNELKDADRRIAEVLAQFRYRLLMVATIAFSFGLILAGTTIIYAVRLEKRAQEKYYESLEAERELKELSKRLVEAEERERRAISRELHDEVGQSLNALLLDVENLVQMSSGDEAFRQGLQKVKTLAENCVNEVRNMALLLRPSMLDDLGLVAALDWQGREVSKRTGMVVDTVEESVSDNLPEDHKTCVYRIVQEALNNCSKHSYAKKVWVVVSQEPHHLRVSIEDDGKGFDPSRVCGLGLIGMNERVSQLGGVLQVDSDPARGTLLRVDLPLPSTSTPSRELSS